MAAAAAATKQAKPRSLSKRSQSAQGVRTAAPRRNPPKLSKQEGLQLATEFANVAAQVHVPIDGAVVQEVAHRLSLDESLVRGKFVARARPAEC